MPVAFDHIAVAAHRIADAFSFLVGELGGRSGYGGPVGEYRWWHWDYPGGGRLEVIEPDGSPGGFVHRFLDRNGPGIHHVTFNVTSLRATCERAESLGYGIVGYSEGGPHWSEAFLHPKQAMGIVVQMVESSHDGDHEHRATPFEEPASPPPPVTVVGVRLRTGDRERALRQWAELLEAEPEETPGELRFTWAGLGHARCGWAGAGRRRRVGGDRAPRRTAARAPRRPSPVAGRRVSPAPLGRCSRGRHASIMSWSPFDEVW